MPPASTASGSGWACSVGNADGGNISAVSRSMVSSGGRSLNLARRTRTMRCVAERLTSAAGPGLPGHVRSMEGLGAILALKQLDEDDV